MIIVTNDEVAAWETGSPSVGEKVFTYFQNNSGTTVAACATATGLTASQVYFALMGMPQFFTAIPENDSEMWVAVIDQMFKRQ